MTALARETCERSREVESAHDGRLDADATAAAMEHARGCAACGAMLHALRSLREAARALPGAAPDAASVPRVRAEVLASARGRRSSPWPARVAVAAVLGLAVGGGWYARRPAPAARATPVARVDGVDLAGAGTLRPGPGAVYRVERAGADTRIALTEGSIRLAVVHRQRDERFVVALTDAEVEVRGTRFVVDAHEGHLRGVRVTEGLVAVRYVGAAERLVPAGGSWSPPVATVEVATAPTAPEVATATARPGVPRATAPAVGSRDFRAGALAYVQGRPAEAAEALQRFLAAAPARDARREDARYVLVLALDATHNAGAERAAREYLAEFPRGVRRAEVTVRLTRRLAARGACDAAAGVALGMPENAEESLRAQAAQALSRCAAAE